MGKNRLPGWLNTDLAWQPGIAHLDARELFPLPSERFQYVFAEHMLEHLTFDEGQACLAECRRVLVRGGVIRIATPSLERLAGLYGETGGEDRTYISWAVERFLPEGTPDLPGFVINNFFASWGHRFIYDRETLFFALTKAGFTNVVEHEVGKSEHPALRGIEGHTDIVGQFANTFETMIFEAMA
jgi:predicted SAM-dependent methyltransferase